MSVKGMMRYRKAAVTAAFPVLKEAVNVACPQLLAAKATAEEQLVKLTNLAEVCKLGGGQKARESYSRKKVLPRDRISKLLDAPDDGMMEIGMLAGLGMSYGDIPGAGIITGIGKIQGRYCLLCANDGTVKGGSYFPITVKKQLQASSLADRCGLPLVVLVDSGGGFLPLQGDFFPDKMHGGRMFYMEAVYGASGLPSVAVVCGSCTAGGAYGPSMCEEAAIVDGLGTLFLGGPPLVKAALGEDVTSEDLGGARMHTGVSGVMDYFVGDEEESFGVVRDVIATTNFAEEEPVPAGIEEPLYPSDTLDALSGLQCLDRAAMTGIISRLVDGSRFREFKGRYGSSLTLGYGHIQGHCVGVAANCGPLSHEDGLKGAHFLQLCEHRQLPVVFLQNSGGQGRPPPDEGSLKGRAAMAGSVACLTTPKICVNVGGCVGDDNHTMCGAGFDPTFLLSWPNGFVEYGPSHGGGEDAQQPPGKKSKSIFQFSRGSSWYNAAHVLSDAVIAPSDTRQTVSTCLDISRQKNRLQFQRKEFPVYRF